MTEPAFEGGSLADETDIDLDQGFSKLALGPVDGAFSHTMEWLGLARAETTAMLPDAKHAIVRNRRNCP